mmetsp:Transcript_67044/g.151556  ORF Transcript_67044/g.151556 Transcript_67044/m.151556 type:complete len:444 (+) Transcript_67044:82-1413(+)
MAALRVAKYTGSGCVVVAATAVGLCARERHGGPRSDVGPWVRASPPWHSRVGVALHALALEAFVASLFVSPERSVTVTYDGGFANLQDALAAAKAANNEGAATNDGQDLGESAGPTVPAATGLLVASNHVSFLDAPVLGFMLGRAASGVGGPLWFLDPLAWTFSVGSKTVLFPERKPWLATFASCLCGLPVQPRWEKHGRENPAELWLAPNATQYLPNLLRVLEAGRQVVIYPEGRLVQKAVEPRDREGRWANRDGRRAEPGCQVAPFYSGIGRLVAHGGGGVKVLPVGHVGLENVLAARDCEYKLVQSELKFSGPATVCVHVGAPLDFSEELEAWERDHPHLPKLGTGPQALARALEISGPASPATSGVSDPARGVSAGTAGEAGAGEASGAAVAGGGGGGGAVCQERRALYRAITEKVRAAVVECRAKAAVKQRELIAQKV